MLKSVSINLFFYPLEVEDLETTRGSRSRNSPSGSPWWASSTWGFVHELIRDQSATLSDLGQNGLTCFLYYHRNSSKPLTWPQFCSMGNILYVSSGKHSFPVWFLWGNKTQLPPLLDSMAPPRLLWWVCCQVIDSRLLRIPTERCPDMFHLNLNTTFKNTI